MTDQNDNKKNKYLKAVTIGATLFFAWCILLMWSWNVLAVDLFELPAAQFKHAFALCSVTMSMFCFLRISAKSRRHLSNED
jgi:hypothetical protein|tara:strand:+ start:101516 stop:101758 length:243 start_codon:yes stop_codon:yes gene_type:complete